MRVVSEIQIIEPFALCLSRESALAELISVRTDKVMNL